MAASRRLRCGALSFVLALVLGLPVWGQTPPAPTPDPNHINLFYGSIPPTGSKAAVLVFVPGFLEDAFMWWTLGNDMYTYAYQAGFRTAFLSQNALNLPSTGSIQTNAQAIEALIPVILSHYGVSRVYWVCHSKGGLDISATLAAPKFTASAKAVFTLSTPNQGDALADWCFGIGGLICGPLGLLIPAVYDMQTSVVTQYRAQWDPYFQSAGIPFYTLSGNTWTGNLLTAFTGPILKSLTGGPNAPPNDGIVTHPESLLPSNYALELGVINGNHFEVPLGHNAFPYIEQQINAMGR